MLSKLAILSFLILIQADIVCVTTTPVVNAKSYCYSISTGLEVKEIPVVLTNQWRAPYPPDSTTHYNGCNWCNEFGCTLRYCTTSDKMPFPLDSTIPELKSPKNPWIYP